MSAVTCFGQTVHQPRGIQNPVNTALDLMSSQFDGELGGTKANLHYGADGQAQRAVENQKSISMSWQGRGVRGAEMSFLEEGCFSQF